MEEITWQQRVRNEDFINPQRGREIFDTIVAHARRVAIDAEIFEPLRIEVASSGLRGITTLTMRMSLGRPVIQCMENG